MYLDGIFRDGELAGDLFVSLPGGHEREHVKFARADRLVSHVLGIPSRAQTPHNAQKIRMARLGTPVDTAEPVKPDKSVRRGQPQIAVLSLRNRVDERGRDAIFVSPDSMRVFGEGLA